MEGCNIQHVNETAEGMKMGAEDFIRKYEEENPKCALELRGVLRKEAERAFYTLFHFANLLARGIYKIEGAPYDGFRQSVANACRIAMESMIARDSVTPQADDLELIRRFYKSW